MAKQSEQILEEQLIAQLQKLGYGYITFNNEAALLGNLKNQLEKHNNVSLSSSEFDKVLNLLNKGSVFEKSKTLRQKQHIVRDNGDNLYFELRQYRNKLSHELMTLLFDGLPQELPEKFAQLIALRVKIEKWWIMNIEIPTNPDFDESPEVKEEDIMTSSQIFNQLIFDMLSGDEKKASYYQNEFKKKFETK